MASNPAYSISPTLRDQSGEDSTFKINLSAPIDLDSPPVEFTNLITALETEVVLGEWIRYNQNGTRRLSNVAEGGGNREDKLLFTYEDTVTLKQYQTEIPTRQTGLTTVGVGSDSVPPASWSATKTAWDAFVRSPDGNPTSLLDVEIIGRNV